MNPSLLTALKKRLLTDLADCTLENRASEAETGTALRPIQIFIGDLPPKKRNPGTGDRLQEFFPCIVLTAVTGYAADGEDEAGVALVCGVYSAEDGDAEGAEMDLALLLSRIRQSLYPCSTYPLEQRYRLCPDSRGQFFVWEKSESQPRPYMQAVLMTHWRMKGLE